MWNDPEYISKANQIEKKSLLCYGRVINPRSFPVLRGVFRTARFKFKHFRQIQVLQLIFFRRTPSHQPNKYFHVELDRQ